MKKFFIAETGMWVTLKVSASVLRTINKKGISMVLKEAKKRGTLAQELGRLVADK
jgi:large subunit ribosomal protein L28